MNKSSNNIDDLYLYVLKKLFKSPEVGSTHEINNARLVLKNINNNIISIRNISSAYLFGELLWYFIGDNSLDFISQFSSFWKNISDDGETCNSAYGYLIQKKHGFNQIEKVIKILKEDPNSRRAKININFPNEKVDSTKDEPCTMSLHFMIRKGKLNCTAVMRSNDIWFGFPYDVAFFTELQKYIARQLSVKYGEYTHFAISLHVYERDLDKIAKIIADPHKKKIKFDGEKFIKNVKDLYYEAKNNGKESMINKIKTMKIYKEENSEN